MNTIFYCYSPTLKNELLGIGEKYIAKGINQNTNRNYWCFLYTNKLVNYLDQRKKENNKYIPNNPNPKL